MPLPRRFVPNRPALTRHLMTAFRDDDSGATAIEYGLILALIAGAIIGIIGLLSGNIIGIFQAIQTTLEGLMS